MQGCEVKDLSAGVVMAAGGTGGILYWLAIFPVDVIKSAMMTDSIDPATRKYPNIRTTARVRAPHCGPPMLPALLMGRGGGGLGRGWSTVDCCLLLQWLRPLEKGLTPPPLLLSCLPACPQALWAEGGVSRFYRGFSPCIMRAAPANGVMLFTVDRVSYLLADR